MTPAMKKINAFRDKENEGRIKIIGKNYCCVVYEYKKDETKEPCAIGYSGRKQSPSFHLIFQSPESRAAYISQWIKQEEERAERQKPKARELKTGDVLRSSWGYEQTNIDYYLVTKLIGKSSVEIVEIGQIYQSADDWGTGGMCSPDVNNIIGEPMRKRAAGTCVRISSYSSASKITPQIIDGKPVFRPDRWSRTH